MKYRRRLKSVFDSFLFLIVGKKVVILSPDKSTSEIKAEKFNIKALHQVARKDESGKDIEFMHWFPSSFLPKPSRSPVCIIIILFLFELDETKYV